MWRPVERPKQASKPLQPIHVENMLLNDGTTTIEGKRQRDLRNKHLEWNRRACVVCAARKVRYGRRIGGEEREKVGGEQE